MSDQQMSLFEGLRRKEEGVAKVIENNADYVREARQLARRIAAAHGFVTSDDIQEQLAPPPWSHPNIMGAIFSDPMFEHVRYVRSRRKEAHGRMIRLWRIAP